MNPPDIENIRIIQKLGRIDAGSLESCDQLLLIRPIKPASRHFRQLPQGGRMQEVMRKSPAGSTPAFTSRLANKRQTLVVAGTLSGDASAFEQMRKSPLLLTNEDSHEQNSGLPVGSADPDLSPG